MEDKEQPTTELTPVTIKEVCDYKGLIYEEVEAEESKEVKRNITRLINFSNLYLLTRCHRQELSCRRWKG